VATAVERALELTHKEIHSPDAIREEIHRLQSLFDKMLPVEVEARKKMKEQITLLEESHNISGISLPILDPVVLTWRNGRKRGIPTPTFAPVPIQQGRVVFAARRNSRRFTTGIDSNANTDLTGLSYTAWSDVRSAVIRKARRREDHVVKFSYTFGGVIPDESRQMILTEQRLARWDSLFLLAETQSKEWAYDATIDHNARRQRKADRARRRELWLDPIIVGVRNSRMFVIDTFDPTSLEAYVASEFTS